MTTCTLCDLPTADQPVTDESLDGSFCCRGCLEVYRSLGGELPADRQLGVALEDGDEDADNPAGLATSHLAVDGMHCSTCEVFLESVASSHEGVYDAEASYAAETIRLEYDPDRVTGDELVEAVSGLGYSARARSESDQRETGAASRILVGALFGMMVMVWYALFLYPTYFGFDPIVEFGTFDGAYLYAQMAIMTGIVLGYTGRPILRGAYVSLRARRPNVDLLVTIAAIAAYSYSTGRLLLGGSDLYYDVTIVVVLAVTIGNYYEERIKRKTTGLLADLTELQVETATRADGGTVPVSEIEPGDELLVTPGERVPVDGRVTEGRAAVDEALVTGESLPETKEPGDSVRGGTIVTDSPLVVEAGPDAESTLDRVVELLWDIQASRPGAQRIADRLATVFVPLVLTLAAVITGVLLLTGAPLRTALLTGLTVLIVSCPCALGLATPLAVAAGLRAAADRGVVVTTPALFEHTDEIDTFVFDKTGTLTDGEMTVRDVTAIGPDAETLLERAGAVEQYADHPVATAIAAAADDSHDVPIDSVETDARGVSATVGDDRVLVGHPDLFRERDWEIPDSLDDRIEATRERGDVAVLVGWDERARGALAVGDSPREGWEDVVDRLGSEARVVVLTGDESPGADRFREHPAVTDVFAGVPPDGKVETVRRLATTDTVAMVGDGSNDAPALAAADVGIALESGTKLATDAADAIVLGGDLQSVPTVFEFVRATNRRIRENLAWAFCYNAVAIPLAVAGALNPLFAALAMATSSLFVVANAGRRLDGTPSGDDGGYREESHSSSGSSSRHEGGATPVQ